MAVLYFILHSLLPMLLFLLHWFALFKMFKYEYKKERENQLFYNSFYFLVFACRDVYINVIIAIILGMIGIFFFYQYHNCLKKSEKRE